MSTSALTDRLYFRLTCVRVAAKELAKEEITIIAEYVGKYVVMDQATAVHRTVFVPPYCEWQSFYVQEQERGGKYRLRK